MEGTSAFHIERGCTDRRALAPLPEGKGKAWMTRHRSSGFGWAPTALRRLGSRSAMPPQARAEQKDTLWVRQGPRRHVVRSVRVLLHWRRACSIMVACLALGSSWFGVTHVFECGQVSLWLVRHVGRNSVGKSCRSGCMWLQHFLSRLCRRHRSSSRAKMPESSLPAVRGGVPGESPMPSREPVPGVPERSRGRSHAGCGAI